MTKISTPPKKTVENSAALKQLESELRESNPEIFKGINHQKKLELLQSFSVTMIHERTHSGPLPDPESLGQYNSIIPNGADRIMKMAENQQTHRLAIEKKVVRSQSFQSKTGQFFGLLMGLFCIACGTYLASIDKEVVGGMIVGTTVISLVSVFVIGKKRQSK